MQEAHKPEAWGSDKVVEPDRCIAGAQQECNEVSN